MMICRKGLGPTAAMCFFFNNNGASPSDHHLRSSLFVVPSPLRCQAPLYTWLDNKSTRSTIPARKSLMGASGALPIATSWPPSPAFVLFFTATVASGWLQMNTRYVHYLLCRVSLTQTSHHVFACPFRLGSRCKPLTP